MNNVVPIFRNLKPAHTILKQQYELERFVQQFERMKEALRLIAELPYDDKETEDGYIWLRDDETRDYLFKAVDIAYQALH